MAEYAIKNGQWRGTRLDVGRVPRSLIDDFAGRYPEPEPPVVKSSQLGLDIWGEEDEEIPNHGDPGYQAELIAWRIAMVRDTVNIVAQAVGIPADAEVKALVQLEEIRAAQLVEENGKVAVLQYVLLPSDEDLNEVIELVMYHSTVTLRGMVEAARRFGVKKGDKYISIFGKGKADTHANGEYNDRCAAQWAHYRWVDFCDLPGPEQSAIATHYRLNGRLEEMAVKATRK